MNQYKTHLLISVFLLVFSIILLVGSSIQVSESSLDTNFFNLLTTASTSIPFLISIMAGCLALLSLHCIIALIAYVATQISSTYVPVKMTLVWLVIIVTIIAGNSALYPFTITAISQDLAYTLFPICIILLLALFLLGLLKSTKKIKAICLSLFIVSILPSMTLYDDKNSRGSNTQPNVILIGIDSLRPDMVSEELTPFIWQFLNENQTTKNITTPIARTFPAWYSILSGMHPINSGARFNLTQQSSLPKVDLLHHSLIEAGYKAIYAQDERRFNNIGKPFGFDKVIGPPANGAEFLFAGLSNLPQVALTTNIKAFHVIFPYVKGNRAAHKTYEPIDFTNQISKELDDIKQPIFLATHFTLPHYPFTIRTPTYVENEEFDSESPYSYLYKAMLIEVDNQVKSLVDDLSEKGILDNSIISILSDHGESFALPIDGPQKAVEHASFVTNSQGHGTNVLSHSQFNVVFSTQLSGSTIKCQEIFQTDETSHYSLIDIRPSIEKCLNIDSPSNLDGKPLNTISGQRATFIESSINPIVISQNRINELKTLANGVYFYTIDHDGRVIVKPQIYHQAIGTKQRAIRVGNYQLSLFPDMLDNIIITDMKNNTWYPATHFHDQTIVEELFVALCDNYYKDFKLGLLPQCKNQQLFLASIFSKSQLSLKGL